ncbi:MULTISPECIES: hypothetical protein [unclassified Brevibacterium]|uniref:hypothetical protein n=1 Tax=unclassified Brevibacterium TaxID=2614124 RepID=UPI001E299C01|nr:MULTISPECIES: hypothetical protein [unclassified Brevibacterium]MDK8433916.1 hypothetical protein [Brevibacterium sp. H-BE7]
MRILDWSVNSFSNAAASPVAILNSRSPLGSAGADPADPDPADPESADPDPVNPLSAEVGTCGRDSGGDPGGLCRNAVGSCELMDQSSHPPTDD